MQGGGRRREVGGEKSHSPKYSSHAQHIELSIRAGILNPVLVTLNGSGIQLAVGPQPLWLRNHSDSIGYPRLSASGESSTTMHRLLHASGSHPIPPPNDPKASGESSTTKHRLLHASGPHPIPPPNDPKWVGKRVKVRRLSCIVSMTFRVVRTNQYNQDLGLIHSTNGNHLKSPNEGSSIITREHCDVLSMQMDSDLVIYRTTLVRTFQVVTICRVDKSEVLVVLISPHYSKRH
ncbi:heme peroxidase [Dorcoceras hygrometricum]|uniref:Heme peroxidase n=1 Tax=Dorcoceras hygrometricum TaxID=472368 RepID=A0A2Z7CNN0_9LAMI|nr:heme peroxidase [Dorcoceras hygrometricum]